MYHTIIVVGSLGKEPEMRYSPDGKPVVNLSVAANRKWINADGTPGEETVWFQVSAWGKLAKACDEYLSKGRQVLVEGRLRPDPETGGPRIWTRQDGTVGASYEVVARNIRFLGSRDNGDDEEEESLPY